LNYICWIYIYIYIYIWTVQSRNGLTKHFETEIFHSNWKNETPTETELTTVKQLPWFRFIFIYLKGNLIILVCNKNRKISIYLIEFYNINSIKWKDYFANHFAFILPALWSAKTFILQGQPSSFPCVGCKVLFLLYI
jgi:hypothetical protein